MIDFVKYFLNGKKTIFFCGYGFEERSVCLISFLKGKLSFDFAFSVGFPSSYLGRTSLWKLNKEFIDDTLSEMSTLYEIINISVKQPMEVRQNLREKILNHNINIKKCNIIIDITSFPKSTLFMLLKELTDSDSSGYIFYIEPVDYELPISSGVKDVRTLPFFGYDYDPNKQKLLIEILGFEGQRAYAIWETFDPHRTIALTGLPSELNNKWKIISEKENELLLTRPNVEKDEISFTNIRNATNKLEEIYNREGENYNIIVSSLGTKLSTIPLYYFANRHNNIFIAFSRPYEHAEHYSYGCKRLYVISFNKEEAYIAYSYDLENE